MLFYVIDIETTGFNKMSDDILEVGYIKCNGIGKILSGDTLYFYKPEFQVESGAQKVHGLTREYLQGYEKYFYRNLAALSTIVTEGNIVGKNNNAFDIPFIRAFLQRYMPYLYTPDIKKSVDVQELLTEEFRNWYKTTYNVANTRKKGTLIELIDMIGLKQEQIKEQFKLEFPNSERVNIHSALYDAYMTLLLFKYSAKKVAKEVVN